MGAGGGINGVSLAAASTGANGAPKRNETLGPTAD